MQPGALFPTQAARALRLPLQLIIGCSVLASATKPHLIRTLATNETARGRGQVWFWPRGVVDDTDYKTTEWPKIDIFSPRNYEIQKQGAIFINHPILFRTRRFL